MMSPSRGPIDPRIVVNYTSLLPGTPLAEGLRIVAESGVQNVGVGRHHVADGQEQSLAALVAEHELALTYMVQRSLVRLDLPEAYESTSEYLRETLRLAAESGAGFVYGTTGPLGARRPEEAVERFIEAVAPLAEYARSLGVPLCIETTNPQFADIDFVHTFRDTVALAESSGLGLVIDLHPIWTEPGLPALLDRVSAGATMVQVSDYIPGTRTLARSVPGSGVIPLADLLGRIIDAGFTGPIDLELFANGRGDGTDAAELRRGAEHVTAVLGDLESRRKRSGATE